jgi:hypothetical protein
VYLLSTLHRVLGSLAALAILVWAVWPRAADAELRATYARLRSSPVPPLLVGSTLPRDTSAEVAADGYTVSADMPGLGRISMVGRAGGAVDDGPLQVRGHAAQVSRSDQATTLTWQEGGAAYTLTLPGQPDATTLQAVAQRVEPLPDAARDAFGFTADTPLLYLVYLPLFVGFCGWASGRLLAR